MSQKLYYRKLPLTIKPEWREYTFIDVYRIPKTLNINANLPHILISHHVETVVLLSDLMSNTNNKNMCFLKMTYIYI